MLRSSKIEPKHRKICCRITFSLPISLDAPEEAKVFAIFSRIFLRIRNGVSFSKMFRVLLKKELRRRWACNMTQDISNNVNQWYIVHLKISSILANGILD